MNALVVGGGVIGLSIALELSQRGADVTVYDTGEPGRAASWAAAGMLAPRTERLANAQMQELCERSLSLYPSYAQRVHEMSGVDPHLRLNGIINAAFDDASFERMGEHAGVLSASGGRVQLLSRSDLLFTEPALSARVRGGMLLEGEGQIDNRRLGRALLAACTSRGVRVETNVRELQLEFDSRRLLGVRTSRGFRAADAAVNAAGAWASHVAGVPQECNVPVRPVKGQMLALQLPAGMVRRTTWIPGAYLVPRDDGRLLVGATVEDADDVRVTAGGVDALLHAATAAAPALRDFAISEMWA
ncbi:MAG TPA: FAD-dependent oxidoreductase, partial [Candidatus Baltobacteraceae bacterium]|nr:FAD-dependent oxidoreductase [Candidatus Baltobacteraceae bacterium]